jgi:uncharacterized protein YajQ (UPF0234 family)
MLGDWCDGHPAALELFTRASSILGYDLAAICRQGPSERLNTTSVSQPAILVTSLAALEVLKEKIVKRQISLKILDAAEPRQSGKEVKIDIKLKAGISKEQAKKLGQLIRDEGPKKVKAQVMGEELRVSSPSRDDLQEIIALVKDADLDFPVQFVNYR